MKSGQILILVLLIVVVALAVGLSVASRNIVNLRTSTQTAESQRAFTTAEGGVEDVLSQLSALSSDPAVRTAAGKDMTIPVGSLQANVNVKGSSVYESKIELGDVGQIDLTGTLDTDYVQVEWAKGNAENSGAGPASVEISEIFGTNSRSSWYFPGQVGRPNETLGVNAFGSSACSGSLSPGYTHCIKIRIAPNPVMLRIKPFWANTTVKVYGVGFDLPVQTYDISSSASANAGVTRKVQVNRTALPMMPAVFDYSMFSEGSILK